MPLHETDITPEAVEGNTATYCPEDNKIRIYCGRLHRDSYLYLCKTLKFTSTPKQDCAFVAVWSCDAEDAARELIPEWDDIGDEDYSPLDRAADRAERFSGYRNKRAAEAHGTADRYADGPAAFGFQSQARADRAANRHNRLRSRACDQWSKAEYWQSRTSGVIAHAQHVSDAGTRRNRILRLETEQRKHLKGMEERAEQYAAWRKVMELEGGDCVMADFPVGKDSYGVDFAKATPAMRAAYIAASNGLCRMYGYHPDDTSEAHSAYDLLNGVWHSPTRTKLRQMTPLEVAHAIAGTREEYHTEDGSPMRWKRHYELRLQYENAMLENEGGNARDIEMVVGGFYRGHQIHKLNKSNATGRVVSVEVMSTFSKIIKGEEVTTKRLAKINIEGDGAGVYRAPTEDDLKALAELKKAAKKERAAEPKGPSLVNPTVADAQILQILWNVEEKGSASTVWEMTQEQYTARSTEYGPCGTVEVCEHGTPISYGRMTSKKRCRVFKVRKGSPGNMAGAFRVVVITDKPQKPIPWADLEKAREGLPTLESMTPRIEDIYALCRSGRGYNLTAEQESLLSDARYVGLYWSSSSCQYGLTELGNKVLAAFREANPVLTET
jgi:hypothetical protein